MSDGASAESECGKAACASGTAVAPGTAFSLVVEARLLVRDGDEYSCPRFAVLHGATLGNTRSLAQQGGDMRAFSLRQKKANGQVLQQGVGAA